MAKPKQPTLKQRVRRLELRVAELERIERYRQKLYREGRWELNRTLKEISKN